MTYLVEHHGGSGRWYPIEGGISSMYDALLLCESIKQEGYGVRIVRECDMSVAMSAEWQLPIDWSVAA